MFDIVMPIVIHPLPISCFPILIHVVSFTSFHYLIARSIFRFTVPDISSSLFYVANWLAFFFSLPSGPIFFFDDVVQQILSAQNLSDPVVLTFDNSVQYGHSLSDSLCSTFSFVTLSVYLETLQISAFRRVHVSAFQQFLFQIQSQFTRQYRSLLSEFRLRVGSSRPYLLRAICVPGNDTP